MKIAIFSDTFFPQVNGVANVAYQSVRMMVERGHKVLVFAPKQETATTGKKESFNYAYLPSLPALVYPTERIAFPFSFSTRKILKEFGPHVIHTHTPFMVGWAAVVAKKTSGAKLVGTHHTFFDHYLQHVHLDYMWAKKMSWKYTVAYYNRCDVVISPTESLRDELIAHGLTRPVVIVANSIDTEKFIPADKTEKKTLKKKFSIPGKSLVYMGRLSYEKSIDKVIQAFSRALVQEPGLSLMIIGDGPERKSLESLCADIKISDKVIFTGVLRGADLRDALAANDCFASASKSENMPLSVLEAAAVGLPILAVAEKGMKEIVEDGVNGFLSPADDVSALTTNIIKIMNHDKMREKMSAAAHTRAQSHSRENVAQTLESVYINII